MGGIEPSGPNESMDPMDPMAPTGRLCSVGTTGIMHKCDQIVAIGFKGPNGYHSYRYNWAHQPGVSQATLQPTQSQAQLGQWAQPHPQRETEADVYASCGYWCMCFIRHAMLIVHMFVVAHSLMLPDADK
jgi:hypothetical protein